MAITLTLDRASYLVGDVATATLSGTAAEMSRVWSPLGTPGSGVPSGLFFSDAAGSVTWAAGWTQKSRTATTVTATKTLTAAGAFTVTATLGGTTYSASSSVSTPGGTGVRKLRGIIPWSSPSGPMGTRAAELLAQDWVGGLSVFQRWDQLTADGSTYTWGPFDNIAAKCKTARKGWAMMIILGNKDNGLPSNVVSGVPANQWITIDGQTFPVFWSVKANEYLDQLMDKIAARYGSDPWLYQIRVTGFWRNHGEPWFAGGVSSKTKWAAAWRATHPADAGLSDAAALVKVQAAYQEQEKQWWADQAARFPAAVSLAQAAGDALYDVAGSVTWEKPGRHPDRLATWTAIRGAHGARSVFQFNGVGGGDGASGYGRWLPNSFGPNAVSPADSIAVPVERRGRIGGQPVAYVGHPDRLTYAQASQMLRNLTAWGYSYLELYGTDALKALDAATTDDANLLAVIKEVKNDWAA